MLAMRSRVPPNPDPVSFVPWFSDHNSAFILHLTRSSNPVCGIEPGSRQNPTGGKPDFFVDNHPQSLVCHHDKTGPK
jgi:hypothetical protein